MMSAARQAEMISAQSNTARKVFEAVPIQDWWTPHKIISQLGDNVGKHQVVMGCLDTLKRSGLIREKDGCFQREPVRGAQDKKGLADLRVVLKEAQTPPETKDPMTQRIDPVEHLSAISQRMHALALRHTQERAELAERHEKEFRELAHEVADVAIEVQAGLEATTEEVQAARDLKALMKRIGG